MAGEVIEVSAKPGRSGLLTCLHCKGGAQQHTIVQTVRIAENENHV